MKSKILAFFVCLVLIAGSVFYGAYSGWSQEKGKVEEQLSSLQTLLDTRVETACNILTVAKRHMDPENELYQRVESEKNILAGNVSLDRKAAAHQNLTRDAALLLRHLSALETVQADSRDKMYAESLLPQMLSQSESVTTQSAYNQSAIRFNERYSKNIVSSFIAGLFGITPCEVFQSESSQPAQEGEQF